MRKRLIEKNTPPEWNVRVLTEDDFWTYCDERNIDVRPVQLEQPGYSITDPAKPIIFIHDELRGIERLYTLYHELGHHFLHPSRIQFFCGWDQKIEFEANVIAACALVPRTLLTHHWPSEIAELYGYPNWLVTFRQKLLEYWEI